MDDKEFNYSLLIRFIDGKASDPEKEQVLAWINSADANKELYFRVKDILDQQRAADISPEDISAQWQRVQRSLAPPRPRIAFNRRWMKYAAIFLLAISIAAYVFYRNSHTPQLVHVALLPSDTARMVLLPDSSQVWLGPGSELQYYKEMERDGRRLWIKGTGYFSVKAQQAEAPFTVHTRRMDVTVLGTSFVVREDDRRSSVVVSTGAVKISASQQEATLRTNERWLLEDGRSRKETVNAALYTAWKDNDPYFQGATLAEVTDMLRIIYEYDIRIEKPDLLKEQAFSGRISLKDTPELWNTLSIMYNVKIIKKEREIVIQPK
jgi:ferric-dicitrate binding protein FerR (iron transport regulator)